MFRRISFATVFAILFAFAGAAFAQTGPVTGRVMLKKADGTTVPVEGALVEALEIGVKASAPPDKTDKKGNFSFAGLKFGARYVLSISAPGARPGYYPNVKAGDENLIIYLQEGDGSKFTAEQVREAATAPATAAAGGKPAEPSAEDKKAQAEYEAKVKAVEATNQQRVKTNEILERTLTEGNAAFEAKNYDVAINLYTEGVAASPSFVGSAPVMLNNRGAAFTQRAVLHYNQNVKATDASLKAAAMAKVRKDFADAVTSYANALEVLKKATPEEVTTYKAAEKKMSSYRGMIDAYRLMVRTEQVDADATQNAETYFTEYAAVETDAAKKDEAMLLLGDVYRVSGDTAKAAVIYRKVLTGSPNNLDAMVGLGLSLVNTGFVDNDKAKLQEGANFLQQFASAAPDTHRYKNDAVGVIESLKAEQNIAPVKSAGGRKKN